MGRFLPSSRLPLPLAPLQFLLLVLVVVHLHVPTLFAANVPPRAACTTDAVLKALKSNSVSASPFCSSYVHVPVTTTFKSVKGVTATTYAHVLFLFFFPLSPPLSILLFLFLFFSRMFSPFPVFFPSSYRYQGESLVVVMMKMMMKMKMKN